MPDSRQAVAHSPLLSQTHAQTRLQCPIAVLDHYSNRWVNTHLRRGGSWCTVEALNGCRHFKQKSWASGSRVLGIVGLVPKQILNRISVPLSLSWYGRFPVSLTELGQTEREREKAKCITIQELYSQHSTHQSSIHSAWTISQSQGEIGEPLTSGRVNHAINKHEQYRGTQTWGTVAKYTWYQSSSLKSSERDKKKMTLLKTKWFQLFQFEMLCRP